MIKNGQFKEQKGWEPTLQGGGGGGGGGCKTTTP